MADAAVDLKKLWEHLAALGAYASPEVREQIAAALRRAATGKASPVALMLPAATRKVFEFAIVRTFLLAPQVTHAAQAGCQVEAVILAHGSAQLGARALHVLWLQSKSAQPLDELALKPFYQPESKSGSLHYLTPRLKQAGLLSDSEAADLEWLNRHRNKVAHGVIFGEVEPPELLALTVRAARTSLNTQLAVLRFAAQTGYGGEG